MKIEKYDLLYQIAERQMGYFTHQQAVECGYYAPNFHRYVKRGEWSKEDVGIYRLCRFPNQDREELAFFYLWSRNKQGVPQGVWSHETALDYYDLCDVMPSKIHMTVPKGFRRSKDIPSVLCLHYENLSDQDVIQHSCYKITSPIRTIVDLIEDHSVSMDHLNRAVIEGVRKGKITQKDVDSIE